MQGKWWLARLILNSMSAGLLGVSATSYLRRNGRSAASRALGLMLYAGTVEILAVTVLLAVYPPPMMDNALGFFARLVQIAGILYFLQTLSAKPK